MKTLRTLILPFAVASLSACSQQPEVPQPVGCSSTDCVRIDEFPLAGIPDALGDLPGFVCLSVSHFKESGPKVCLRDTSAETKLVWFGAAPSSISATHVDGRAEYIELLFTRNEFDRIEKPMLLRFGKPTRTVFSAYRNNTMPSRLHSWETPETLMTLFDNSASTSIQITYK